MFRAVIVATVRRIDSAQTACESPRMKTHLLSILLAIVAVACGGKKSEPAKPEPAPTENHEAMVPELAKFHDVLAPHWHAAKGDQRMTETCAALTAFQTNADALAKATPPKAADAAQWTAGTKELVGAVAGLETSCKAKDATAFEPAFERVHHGFHALLESSGGGEHHEGPEHEEGPHEGDGINKD